jgi:hypothetical protein
VDRGASKWELTSTVANSAAKLLPVEKCPKGYAQVAAFLSSEPNFSLYRGFSYLYSRVLLNLQDEIVVLEGKLSDLDMCQEYNGQVNRLKSRRTDVRKSRAEPEVENRQTILSEIQSKLTVYSKETTPNVKEGLMLIHLGEVLKQARELASFHKPSNRDYRSVRTWFWNTSSLVDPESKFIKHREDIISLHSGREWSTFDEIVEKVLLLPKSSWLRVSRTSCNSNSYN